MISEIGGERKMRNPGISHRSIRRRRNRIWRFGGRGVTFREQAPLPLHPFTIQMATPICPDCQRVLEGGFLLAPDPNGGGLVQWVHGPPERNFFGYLKLKGRRQIATYAWRCPGCSQVRLYAPDA